MAPQDDLQDEHFTQIFADELHLIQQHLNLATELIPKKLTELTEVMAKALDQTKHYDTGSSTPRSGTSTAPPGTSLSDWDSKGGGGLGGGGTDAIMRAQLQQLQSLNDKFKAPPADVTAQRPTAVSRRDLSADHGVEGTFEGGLPHSRDWRSRATTDEEGGIGSILPFPRYPGSEPTTKDFLNYLASMTANWAQKRQTTLDTRAQGGLRQRWDTEGWGVQYDENNNPLDLPEEMQKEWDAGAGHDTRLGKVSDFFAGAENAYAQSKYIQGIFHKLAAPVNSAQSYAYQTGFEGSPGSFMGIRSPFSSATWAGAGQKLSEMGFAINNDVTPGQAATIYNNLFSQGWYRGDATNNMRTAAANMMQQDPYIASMPQYYEMMDKATRFGAATLGEFNSVMYQVPQAAKTAQVSITDMMSQMDQLGQYNTQIGGTYQQGQLNAVDWAQTTGLPPALMSQLMQNPLVIGQTFAATGLMPQLQGQATPFQHTEGIMGALNMASKGLVTPQALHYTDPITGMTSTVSGEKQKEGMLAYLFHMPVDQVHAMLKNQTGIMHGAQIENSSEMLRNAIIGAGQHGRSKQAQHELLGAPWSRLLKAMKGATGFQGEKIFEDWNYYRDLMAQHQHRDILGDVVGKRMSKAEAHKLAQAKAISNVRDAGTKTVLDWATGQVKGDYLSAKSPDLQATYDQLRAAQGGSFQQQVAMARKIEEGKVKGIKFTTDIRDRVAQDRHNQVRKYERGNTKMFGPETPGNSGPSLTIHLSPAAQKMFKLTDPSGQAKAAAGAGSTSISLNPYVNQYTAAPYPNMNTAGGAANFGDQNTFNDYGGGAASGGG